MKSFFRVCLAVAAGTIVQACGSHSDESGGSLQPRPLPEGFGERNTEEVAPPTFSLLGNEKGNGGDAVVCFKTLQGRNSIRDRLIQNRSSGQPTNPFAEPATMQQVQSIEMLDLYEYRLPTGFPPVRKEVMTVEGSFMDALPKVIIRAEAKTSLGRSIDVALQQIPLSTWKAAEGVVEIDDSDHSVILPANCILVQLAVRREDVIYYDTHLFSVLDEVNRLALVVHELTYKVAVELGKDNSRHARQAVGLMLSKADFDELTGLEIYRQLAGLGKFAFPYALAGQEFWIESVIEDNGLIPVKFKVQTAALGINGWLLKFQQGPNAQNFVKTDDHGNVIEAMAAGTKDQLQWSTPGLLLFADGKATRLDFGSATNVVHYLTAELRARALRLDDAVVRNIELNDNYVTLPTALGSAHLGCLVELKPGTLQPRYARCGSGATMTAWGYVQIGLDINFDENGVLRSLDGATGVEERRTGCGFDRCFLVFDLTQIFMRGGAVSYFADGNISSFQRGDYNPGGPDITLYSFDGFSRSSFASMWGVDGATFHPNNRPKAVTFGPQGVLEHRDFTNQNGRRNLEVRSKTIEFDEEGKVLTPIP